MRFVINKIIKQRYKQYGFFILLSLLALVFSYTLLFKGFSIKSQDNVDSYGGGLVGEVKKMLALQAALKQEEVLRKEFIRLKLETSAKKIAAERQFYRISFFAEKEMAGSLAIPLDWQDYLITKENKETFELLYHGKATTTSLLSLRTIDPLLWPTESQAWPGWKILKKEKRIWFAYLLPRVTLNAKQQKQEAKLQSLLNERELVISSFKSLKTK